MGGVYASSTDQVLLAVLWALREDSEKISEPALARGLIDFQHASGMVLYGPLLPSDSDDEFEKVQADLGEDLQSLQDRQLVFREPNPHARVTLIAAPVAEAFNLPSFLRELVDCVKRQMVNDR